METINDTQCLICYENENAFTMRIGGCNHNYCMMCCLESFRNGMHCPLDRGHVKKIKVFNNIPGQDEKEILTLTSRNEHENLSFQKVIDHILTIDNLDNREDIEKMGEIDPYLLWVGLFVENEGKVTREMVHNHFNRYGQILDVIVFPRCAYILFACSQHGLSAEYSHDRDLFHDESYETGSFSPEFWHDLNVL